MWTRYELKTRAKAVLKLSYWKAFLVSLVIAIVGGDARGGGSSGSRWNLDKGEVRNITNFFGQTGSEDFIVFAAIAIVLAIIGVVLVIRVFLGYPLEVGGRRYFIQSTQKDFNIKNLGFAFSRERYMDIVITMLWRGFLNFLWYLLLIVPGIIKYYAYSMVPYILADNPKIGRRRAIDISNAMTDSQKFEMFVLDLSFIGWYILGALLFGIGVLFVMPYENATKAELYLVLRENAIINGVCTPEELMLDSEPV